MIDTDLVSQYIEERTNKIIQLYPRPSIAKVMAGQEITMLTLVLAVIGYLNDEFAIEELEEVTYMAGMPQDAFDLMEELGIL
ncbi:MULTISPECIES: hypothetical protein [Aerococcus]|uniref:hypothetical protein n=1 Tax=Aerococcus TaxID=1375 RepID=UPI0018A784AA|nr:MULTISPECIES: hypothetical protein [Aerococcus]MCY3035689.1 hypothetical protein [Aerococcus sp. Group 2]MCY3039823.1 hypothetical protein [Aerococcus sp. Group 2]MCY3040357.1 hypothetical protein [Aerococcus sp. Group 2]MCY3043281.1 hypothetical protein [Aerococcus sp. Group 2]MDK6519802.1 hypothetical protein [Aerococcus urinae]